MAKVGRASRNSSLMRVESLDGTGNKTIASAESGEVYLLAGDPASNRTITLPTPKAGAYVKFLVTVKADTANWIIAVPSGLLLGAVLAHVDSSDATTDVASDASDDHVCGDLHLVIRLPDGCLTIIDLSVVTKFSKIRVRLRSYFGNHNFA